MVVAIISVLCLQKLARNVPILFQLPISNQVHIDADGSASILEMQKQETAINGSSSRSRKKQ